MAFRAAAAPRPAPMPGPEMRFTSREVATFRPKVEKPPDAIKLTPRTRDVLKFRANNPDARAQIQAAGRPDIPKIDTEAGQTLRTRVGAEGDPRANAIVTEATEFTQYTSMLQEAQQTGRTREQIAKAHGMDVDDLLGLETRVLDRMTGMQIVKDLIPGLSDLPPEAQQEVVGFLFAQAEDFQAVVATRMSEVLKKAEGLSLPTPEQAAQPPGEAQPDSLDSQRTTIIARLKAKLGPKLAYAVDETAIESSLQAGYSARETTDDLFNRIIGSDPNKIDNPTAVRQRITLQSGQSSLKRRIAVGNATVTSLQAQKKAETDPALKQELARQIGAIKAEVAGFEVEQGQLTSQLDANGKLFDGGVDPDLQVTRYQEVRQAVYGEEDPSGKIVGGGVATEIELLGKNASARQTAESNKGKAQEAKTAEQGQRDAQEASLRGEVLTDMETMIAESIREVMLQRHTELTEWTQRSMAADKIKLDESGRQDQARAVDVLARRLNSNWSRYDERKKRRVVNRAQIAEDMQRLVGQGDEGLRRLILRDLTSGENPVIKLTELTPDGNASSLVQKLSEHGIVVDASGAVQEAWKVADLSALSETNRGLLDEMVKTQGDRYLHQLFTDYFAARTTFDRTIAGRELGALALTDGQWNELHRYFGDRIQKGWQANTRAKQFGARLKAQGINPNKLGKLGAFLFALGSFAKDTNQTPLYQGVESSPVASTPAAEAAAPVPAESVPAGAPPLPEAIAAVPADLPVVL